MTPELEFDSLLFELDKNMTRVHSSITHDVCTSLRVIVASLHERNLKLEARIAELERMHSFSNNIDVADDLFKRAVKADRDLRHANARATVSKILGVEEPIEGSVITTAGGKTRTAAEHLYGTKTSDTVGYIPDDFRG